MKKFLFILLVSLLPLSCGIDPCHYDCSEGPIILKMVVLDKTSGENIFINSNYSFKDLQITNAGEGVDYLWNEIKGIIVLGPFDEVNENKFRFNIKNQEIFTLSVPVEEVEEKCCTNFIFGEVTVKEAEIELNNKGIYEVKI